MKRIGSSLFLCLILSACAVSPVSSDQALDASMQYLRERGLEEAPYDSSAWIEVGFPDQASGMFVALGYLNPPRGYLFLFKHREDQLEQLDFKQTQDVAWGLYSVRDGNKKAEIESVQFFAGTNQTVKVMGAGYINGVWQDGYFEIVKITEAEFETLFSAADFWTDQTMFDVNFQYEFRDQDQDGNVDYILQTSQRCEYQVDSVTGDKQIFDCLYSQMIYKFDGKTFKEQIPP